MTSALLRLVAVMTSALLRLVAVMTSALSRLVAVMTSALSRLVAVMTSALSRLVTVFWWLLVAGSVGVAVCALLFPWESYHSSQEYTASQTGYQPEPAFVMDPQPPAQTPEATAAARLEVIRRAVDSWEASIQMRDPDYAQISGAVRGNAQRLLQERGIPRTPEQAVALVQAAYDEVKRERGALPDLPVLELDRVAPAASPSP